MFVGVDDFWNRPVGVDLKDGQDEQRGFIMTSPIGQSVIRVDALAKVSGKAKYPGDLVMEGMLHAKILFSGRPHARVLGVDSTAAEAVPGVIVVLTSRDVPVNEYGLQTADQPVLCGPGSEKDGTDCVRFVGDQVAVIVAETEEAAEQGRDLVVVEYEDLPLLTDPFKSLDPDAPRIHPNRLPNPIHPELMTEGNHISHHQIRKGDMKAGWAAAEVVVEGEYQTQPQEHAYLQPEAGLAYIDEQGRVTVVVAGQWTVEDQKEIAHALNLSMEQVRVIYPAIGGAFGGREDMSIQIVLALAAWRLKRPVKLVWNRQESIVGHHKRHAVWARAKFGATREGKLTAAEVKVLADGGAYCYTTNKVLGNTVLTCTGPYDIPNIFVDVDGVYTNNPPGGAFRGFGAPQGAFFAEMQMNKLAQALNMDPVALRMRNLLGENSLTVSGTPLRGGVHLVEVTQECARAAGWKHGDEGWIKPVLPASKPSRRRGLGVASACKNVGFSYGYQENCWAKIELRGGREIEEALVYIGSAEVGQGTHTVIKQMAAGALNLPLNKVCMVASDTASSPGSAGSVSASRMTYMSGNAVRGAAMAALERWRAEDRPAIAEYTYLAPKTTQTDPVTGYGSPNFAFGYVSQAVDVEVDIETGELYIKRIVCAIDVGKAVNRQQVEGQVEGGVIQALGWSTCENFITRDGKVLTPDLTTYLIPTAGDVPPRVDTIIMELPDPNGPWGARGMAEMPFIPLAPALAAAIHDATGVWYDRLPFTAERIQKGLCHK